MRETDDDLLILGRRYKFVQSVLANLKDTMGRKIHESWPDKHRGIYDTYEPIIKRWSYELAELQQKVNTHNPTPKDKS